jgi:hypothetical protein
MILLSNDFFGGIPQQHFFRISFFFSIMGSLSRSVVLDVFHITNYGSHYGQPWDILDSIRAVSEVIRSSHVGKTAVPFSIAVSQLFCH